MSKKFSNATDYPLTWPDSFPRTKTPGNAQFSTSLARALENVQDSLAKFAKDSGVKIDRLVISRNYSLTNSKPDDSGVAVYFNFDGEETCIPVDRYKKIEHNLQAIHHCLEADRTKLRHGGINLVKAAFRGYVALPSYEPDSAEWWAILEVDRNAPRSEVEKQYKKLRSTHHPDNGGTEDGFREITLAWTAYKNREAVRG